MRLFRWPEHLAMNAGSLNIFTSGSNTLNTFKIVDNTSLFAQNDSVHALLTKVNLT